MYVFVFMFLYMCICLHIYFECVFFVCNFEYFCIHNLNCLACICILIILQVMCICILHLNAIILCFVCFLNPYVDVFNITKVLCFCYICVFYLYSNLCVSNVFCISMYVYILYYMFLQFICGCILYSNPFYIPMHFDIKSTQQKFTLFGIGLHSKGNLDE